MSRLSLSCLLLGSVPWFFLGPVTSSILAGEIDFQRQIQPILSEHCNHCHGVDEASRKGGLRMDLRDEAIKGAIQASLPLPQAKLLKAK